MSLWIFGLRWVISRLHIIRKCFATPYNVSNAFLHIGHANGSFWSGSISLVISWALSVVGALVFYGLDDARCGSVLVYCGISLILGIGLLAGFGGGLGGCWLGKCTIASLFRMRFLTRILIFGVSCVF